MSHSVKNLAFHSLLSCQLTILPILTVHHIYISLLKVWENVLFELGSERVNNVSTLPFPLRQRSALELQDNAGGQQIPDNPAH